MITYTSNYRLIIYRASHNCSFILFSVNHLFGGGFLLTRHHEKLSSLLVIFAVVFDPGHTQSPCWDRKQHVRPCQREFQQELLQVSRLCKNSEHTYTSPDSTGIPRWAGSCASYGSGSGVSSSSSAPPSPHECSHSGFSSTGKARQHFRLSWR